MIFPLLQSCWGFSFAHGHGVSPQSCSSTTQLPLQCHTAATPVPTVLLGLLCPWRWDISSQLLQYHAAATPTGVGSLSLLQGIFSTQGLNPRLLHCKQIPYRLSHQGPKMADGVSVILDLETHFWCTSGHTSFFRRPQKHLSVLEQPLLPLVAGLIHDD